MTKSEAKELSLRLWGILRDNPSIDNKSSIRKIDEELYGKIADCESFCPLCEANENCGECPLYLCTDADAPYVCWGDANTDEKRADAASAIYEKINAWNIEEDTE